MFEVFLKKIKLNPALYLGTKDIRALSFIISGYEQAILDIKGERVLFNTKFQRFIEQKYQKEKTQTIHWTRYLLNEHSDAEAFDLFFDYFEEFTLKYPNWKDMN